MPSKSPADFKTQQAYVRYFKASTDKEKQAALTDLTHIAIRACGGLHPPISTDKDALNKSHAHFRYKTNRFVWIQNWLQSQLQNPRPDDNGPYLVQRCRWRLLDCIRKDGRKRKGKRKPKRTLRKDLPSRADVLLYLEGFETPLDSVLCDLWERLMDAYPDWRLTTDKHLAVIYGVHPNVIRSRRHALAAVMHSQAENDSAQVWILNHCLRLKIGHVRKTDIFKMKEVVEVTRAELVGKPKQTGTYLAWETFEGRNFPQRVPIFTVPGEVHYVPPGGWPTRCPYVDEDGLQCTYAQSKCPHPDHKPTI